MTICPSCGSNIYGDLCRGCPSCGGRAVGPPLAKAEYELRSYGRAVGVAASGALMFAGFLGSVIAVLIEFKPASVYLWTVLLQTSKLVTASETAAWRLKWFALPLAASILWSGRRLMGSIRRSQDRFGGLSLARAGFTTSAIVTISIAALIGVTIPERLRQRQYAIDAAVNARGYTLHRALLEYRELKGSYPTDIRELGDKSILPDPYGTIAEALNHVDATSYQPTATLASTKVKPVVPRGGALRDAATTTNADSPGLSFTNYKLRLPSEHRLFSSDDDFVMEDGLIKKASVLSPPAVSSHSGGR